MSIINVSNLTFSYENSYDNIFENVSFHIDTDWKLGFIGRNGRGKTTFLNLLMRKFLYSGSITSPYDFDYFPYTIPDDTMVTIDIIKGLFSTVQLWEVERELFYLKTRSELLNRPFYSLSKGEQTKVLLATMFLSENRFLLIDEPTNHLDMSGRKIVSQYLNTKKGFILVSHDRDFIDACIDHVLSINKANIEIQKGNFSSWWCNKQSQDNYEITQNEGLKKDIKRLQKSAREKAKWSFEIEAEKIGNGPCDRGAIGHRAAKMMKRSKNIERRQNEAITEKQKLLKNIDRADTLKISQLDFHAKRFVSLDKVSIFYGDKTVCKDIYLDIEKGDRVSIAGDNGSGKTSLIKLISGENISYTGNLYIGSNLTISYVSQDTSSLSGSLADFIKQYTIDESLFKAILRKLDFSRVQFEKDISDFSAGQKKKLSIARSLCESAHLHIWDEPLNYIDVLSRIQIENVLLEYKPTILFVEHDKVFCQKIANKSLLL
ncbi:MAG: ABC-F type ribosomal protection protein [Candidatus Cloacimonetes bacterium]|nr:ABC-F type ribosomal protection protein [Candidatus Cloacimonadota bacterium]